MRYLLILAFSAQIAYSQTFIWSTNYSPNVDWSDSTLIDSATGLGNSNYKLLNFVGDTNNLWLSTQSETKLIHNNDTQYIATLFANHNYDSLEYYLIELRNDSLPSRLTRVEEYSLATESQNIIPPEFNPNAKRVGAGRTYSNIASAIAASNAGDTIYVDDGNYDYTDYLTLSNINIVGIGDVKLTSTGLTYVVLGSGTSNAFMEGFEIDGEGNTTNCFLSGGAFSNKKFSRCVFANASTNLISTNSTVNPAVFFIENSVFISDNKPIEYWSEIELYNSFVKDSYLYNRATLDDTVKVIGNIFNYNKTGTQFIILNFDEYQIWDNKFTTTSGQRCIYNTSGSNEGNNISIKNNKFYNTGLTVAVIQITVDAYDTIIIDGNYFESDYAATIATTNISRFTGKVKYNNNTYRGLSGDAYPVLITSDVAADYVELIGNDLEMTSLINYSIRVGSEASGSEDNTIDSIVIKNNRCMAGRYANPDAVGLTSHGIFIGFQSPIYSVVSGNWTEGHGIGHVYKGSTGTSMNNIVNYLNVTKNNLSYGIYCKGVDSMSFYNNTHYNEAYAYNFTINSGVDPATHTIVKNCVMESNRGNATYFFDAASSTNFLGDSNIFNSSIVAFYDGANRTLATWQGYGYDLNSFNESSNLKSAQSLWPIKPSNAIGNSSSKFNLRINRVDETNWSDISLINDNSTMGAFTFETINDYPLLIIDLTNGNLIDLQ